MTLHARWRISMHCTHGSGLMVQHINCVSAIPGFHTTDGCPKKTILCCIVHVRGAWSMGTRCQCLPWCRLPGCRSKG